MDVPEIRHASIGDARVAYQVLGEGPDLIYFSGMLSNLDIRWDDPSLAGFHRRLASFSRLILFDRRGTGLSDSPPPGKHPSWELFVDDVRAVLDAVGSESAFVFGVLDAGPTAILFAASDPDRTSGLVLANTTARFVRGEDYPNGLAPDAAESVRRSVEEHWGTEPFAALAVPSRRDDPAFVRWYARFQRASTRPREAAAWLHSVLELDVRAALRSITLPTLILHAKDYAIVPIEQGRYLGEAIPHSRFVELQGSDGVVWTENVDQVLAEVEEFVTGVRRGPVPDRVLATVLITDIVGSTERAATLGDRRWADLLRAHHDVTRGTVAAFRGRFIKSTGDGVLATFDGPSRALGCAAEIRGRLRDLGLEIRAGLHSGEVELLGDDVGGIGVHNAARVLDEAEPEQILVTRTVRDLVAGSDIELVDRGTRQFKGVPDEWNVYEAVT